MSNWFNLFHLFKLTSYCIGADVDETHIKLVELSYRSGRYHVENYAIFSRHSDWAIQWAAAGFFSKNMIVSASNTQVITQNITLSAKFSKQEQATFLVLEMEKLALLPADNLAIAFQITSASPTHLNVFCAAIRQETVNKLLALFQMIDCPVNAVDLNEKAIERIRQYGGPEALEIHQNQRSIEWIEQWKKDTPTLTTAIGLAMHPQDNQAFNFLSWSMFTQKKQKNMPWIISSIIISFCFIAFLFFGFNSEKSIQIAPINTPKIIKKPLIQNILTQYGFQQISIVHLKYVGFLENNQHRAGLIQTPDNHIYTVFIGDEIGKEKAVITQLSDKAIIVKLNHRRISIE